MDFDSVTGGIFVFAVSKQIRTKTDEFEAPSGTEHTIGIVHGQLPARSFLLSVCGLLSANLDQLAAFQFLVTLEDDRQPIARGDSCDQRASAGIGALR